MNTTNTQSLNAFAVVTAYASHQDLLLSLPPLLRSPHLEAVIVLNASGEDGTRELVQSMGAIYLDEDKNSYNHGLSRERARHLLKSKIVLFCTADAILNEEHSLEALFAPLYEKKAALCYARQIAKKGASLFESFPRAFNYPELSHLRGIEDQSLWGSYLIFNSNSFCAYRQDALDAIGGFPRVLMGEDWLVAWKLLQTSQKIAYCAETKVTHSHRYTLFQEWKRHFDAGYARRPFEEAIEKLGGDHSRGKLYVKKLFWRLFEEDPLRIPYAFLHIIAKWLGYKIGRWGHHFPASLNYYLSSQRFYW